MIFVQAFLGALLALIVHRLARSTFNTFSFWWFTRKLPKGELSLSQLPGLDVGLGVMPMCKCSCGASHPKMHSCSTCGCEHVDWKGTPFHAGPSSRQ